MPKHYHVGHNIAGYLPESDVYYLTSKRDALAEARAQRDRILEEGYGPMSAQGLCGCGHDKADHRWDRSARRHVCQGGSSLYGVPPCPCGYFDDENAVLLLSSDAKNGDFWLGDTDPSHLNVHVWTHECYDDCDPEGGYA